ncbi:MAG: threonine/serine exporter family protein [Anaerovorax sp.]
MMQDVTFPLYAHFIFSWIGTAGFCLLAHVPSKYIVAASVTGSCGWTLYKYLVLTGNGSVIACFLGACLVALVSELFSRAGKEATTLFIIPGILPLVPGFGMYHTMVFLLEGDFQAAAGKGTETMLMAGGIALAILLIASFTRLFTAALRRINNFIDLYNGKRIFKKNEQKTKHTR